MVMASWLEAVQAATSHMENANLTIYLAPREDTQRAMTEYVTGNKGPQRTRCCPRQGDGGVEGGNQNW